MTDLSKWLEYGLDKSRMSRYALAGQVSVSQTYLSKFFSGQIKQPDRAKIIRIGTILSTCWTQSPQEQNSYVNEGLAAAKYAPLEATEEQSSQWKSEMLEEVRTIKRLMEGIEKRLTAFDA